MVSLMDRLLKLENLDLHLTPYNVLATGQDEGMMEFIPSRSLAQVLYYLWRCFIDMRSATTVQNYYLLFISRNLTFKACLSLFLLIIR